MSYDNVVLTSDVGPIKLSPAQVIFLAQQLQSFRLTATKFTFQTIFLEDNYIELWELFTSQRFNPLAFLMSLSMPDQIRFAGYLSEMIK